MSIGEFSGLSGLSPKRLRSYAASGLLTPAGVDPDTAYRYYSPAQLPDARLIDALRRAGISLGEIRLLLQDRSRKRLDRWARHIRVDAERKQEALALARELLTPEDVRLTRGHRGTERDSMLQLHVAGRTDTGHVRDNNEDAIVTRNDLVAVADGMGGHPGGEVASALATAVVAATFTGSSPDELAAAVRAANWIVWQRGSSTAELEGMGTTLCAVGVIEDGALAVVNVGDSRAYLAHQGSLRRLTEDHTVTAELVRRGELTEAEAAEHPHRRLLTRALGVGPQVQIDTARVPVVPGDRVLVCSDGLFSDVSNEELESLMRSEETPESLAGSVVELALSKGGHDNVSAVVADVC